MARGINRVILVGNLGGDPEVRHMTSGTAVANFNIATSESWLDKQSGEKVEKTEWHRISIFGKLAEVAGEYLKKGARVYIEGKLQTNKWQDQSGQDRYTTQVVARELLMLGGATQSEGSGQQSGFRDEPKKDEGFEDGDIPF